MKDTSPPKDKTRETAPVATASGISRVLEAHQNERHIIVLQDFPDPDAISSAFAHQLISERFDIEVDIVYAEQISHQQNIALVKLLGIELVPFDLSPDVTQYDGAIFVDNQGTTSNRIVDALEAAEVPPLIIVDHHEPQGRLEAEFEDLRRTEATATIYAEYMQDGLLEMDKANRDHVLVATALMHGILTDTGGFIRAGEQDFDAAAFLSQYGDADLLEQIMSQARSRRTMEVIQQALGNRLILESFSISGIGYLRTQDRDAIPQAADFLLTEENVHTAIVYGILTGDDREEHLIGSMRTSKITIAPDTFIKDLFGTDAAGHYFGGGKPSAGAFDIPIGFLAGEHSEEYRDLKWQVYDKQVKQKIFGKIGVEHPSRDG
jgi:nanoRNase/pAp phosphatase (c-di-AMP/oligoRNAs hydrolase)